MQAQFQKLYLLRRAKEERARRLLLSCEKDVVIALERTRQAEHVVSDFKLHSERIIFDQYEKMIGNTVPPKEIEKLRLWEASLKSQLLGYKTVVETRKEEQKSCEKKRDQAASRWEMMEKSARKLSEANKIIKRTEKISSSRQEDLLLDEYSENRNFFRY